MVICAIHALGVIGEHGSNYRSRQECPRIRGHVVDLAVLAAFTAAPGATDGEDAAVGGGG
jgi:hypothetical protein